jgi:undecaprenyl-diphosphatase
MSIEQIIVLALIQGITEFLPISSSGHLILVPALTGWPDQGVVVDVMTHMGSLLAVLVYFWRDVVALGRGLLVLLTGRLTPEGRMALYIIAGTVPIVIVGALFKVTGLSDLMRSPVLVAWDAIIFGVLLYLADIFGAFRKTIDDIDFRSAMIIGAAQALALIPGTSRSGITMTAGRALGYLRPDAARFSFLLSIPATAAAGVLILGDALEKHQPIGLDALITGGLTFLTALATIAFLMAIIRRHSFLPFVVYRVLLGAVLLGLAYGGALPHHVPPG